MQRTLETPLNQGELSQQQIAAVKKLFSMGNLTPLLHSKQKELHKQVSETTSEDFTIFSGRQWGKTHFGLCYAISYCLQNPGSRVLYYAPVKEKLADIVNDGLEVITQWAPEGLIKRQKSSHRWKIGKSELRLCVLERAHVGKNRGLNAKGLICIEEGCFVSSDDFRYAFENIIEAQRLRYKPKLFIITTPSEDESHYVHTVLLPRLSELSAVANYSIYDNPFLTLEQIEKVRAKVTSETWDREYCALITRSVNTLVIPEFTDDYMRKLQPPTHANWITSIDFSGGAIDANGISLSYFDYERQKFCVYRDAMIPANATFDEIIAEARELEKVVTGGEHLRVCDVPPNISTYLYGQGFSHITPTKGPGSMEASLSAFRVAMQNGEVEVDESCVKTRNQLKFGKYDRQRKLARSEDPDISHLDILASLYYAFKHRNTSNPFPAHFYGAPGTHYLPNAPTQTGMQSSFKKLFNQFDV